MAGSVTPVGERPARWQPEPSLIVRIGRIRWSENATCNSYSGSPAESCLEFWFGKMLKKEQPGSSFRRRPGSVPEAEEICRIC